MPNMQGPPPLTGLKVIEFAGLAPGPFAGLLLADAGASVLRIDRPSSSSSSPPQPTSDALTRHKTSIPINLKSPAGHALVLALARTADVLIDPFRPGVLEKLRLGPATLCAPSVNPRLIYARMTGFRRDGRYAAMAGHDINYLAVSGVLSLLGRRDQPPTPPVNILGDFAGGGAVLFQGILLALLARGVAGTGQVVEANMVDGANYLATFARLGRKTAAGRGPRGTNLLDTGAPFYDAYETRRVPGEAKQYMAVGALEPQFYAELLKGLGLEGQGWEGRRNDRSSWGEMRRVFERVFRTKTRAEWEAVFDGTDACCTPVLEYAELEEAHKRRKEEGLAQGMGMSPREGDQRPVVTLRDTPLLAVDTGGGTAGAGAGAAAAAGSRDASLGQGPGVEGDGYAAKPLVPGDGGQETLKDWLGWQKGTHFDLDGDGGYVLKTVSKL